MLPCLFHYGRRIFKLIRHIENIWLGIAAGYYKAYSKARNTGLQCVQRRKGYKIYPAIKLWGLEQIRFSEYFNG